eukprot:GHVU01058718.1.p1 GENE.GHVU01058718.1~~GHVU01058718.1.p1  ORF type:complete len:325 (-),score=61.00 GHVU01058718.1:1756-2730(-)
MCQRSLDSKFGEINRAVSVFSGLYSAVVAAHRSGASDEDDINKALTLHEADTGGPFKFVHCWRVLRESPKWAVYLEDDAAKKLQKSDDSRKRPSPSTSGTQSTSNNDESGEGGKEQSKPSATRPIGGKCAKAANAAAAVDRQARFSPMEKLAAAVQAKANAIVGANDLAIMTMPITGLTADARRYIELQQKQIMHRAEEHEKAALKVQNIKKAAATSLCGDLSAGSEECVSGHLEPATGEPGGVATAADSALGVGCTVGVDHRAYEGGLGGAALQEGVEWPAAEPRLGRAAPEGEFGGPALDEGLDADAAGSLWAPSQVETVSD